MKMTKRRAVRLATEVLKKEARTYAVEANLYERGIATASWARNAATRRRDLLEAARVLAEPAQESLL